MFALYLSYSTLVRSATFVNDMLFQLQRRMQVVEEEVMVTTFASHSGLLPLGQENLLLLKFTSK